MHTEAIKSKINQLLQLPERSLELFWRKLKPETLVKGEYYITAGDSCRNIALVISGALISFYVKEGKEIIEDFCIDNCFIADYPSFIHAIPARKNFRALSRVQLLTISREELERLYAADIVFQRAGRLVAEHLFASWELTLRDTIFLTPAERYEKLLRERPKVIQAVPQYLIASFLNITPEYLSQIRRKLFS
jgi:CRP-like cAMP-binding protein